MIHVLNILLFTIQAHWGTHRQTAITLQRATAMRLHIILLDMTGKYGRA